MPFFRTHDLLPEWPQRLSLPVDALSVELATNAVSGKQQQRHSWMGVVRSHSAADCSPSQPSRGRPRSKICKPDTWRQRARRATQKIKLLVVQRQSILDKHGQERAAMAETLEGVLVLSAKDAGESDRADATFKTLLRAAMSPFPCGCTGFVPDYVRWQGVKNHS